MFATSALLKRLPAILLLVALPVPKSLGRELSPQFWSLELKGGLWLPQRTAVSDFFGCCEPTGALEFGPLIGSQWGFEMGIGFMDSSGRALGTTSGQVSGDRFNFLLLPLHNSVVYRADFRENQLVVPYAKIGSDYVFFRENLEGEVTRGFKYGLHAAAGLQILLEVIDEISISLESDAGINDIYLTLEGRYAWIDSFGQSGLDLTNWTVGGGFLFEF